MATIAELKEQLAAQENVIASLKPPVEAAQVTLNQAQDALSSFLAQPNNIQLTDLLDAKKAAAADPTNAQIQQQVQTLQSQWDAQQAVYLPLLKTRDEAGAALLEARKPLVQAESVAGDIEVEIAKIDPSQASPAAVQYLKDFGGYPVTTQSDPALANQPTNTTNQIQNATPATTTNPDINNGAIGLGVDTNVVTTDKAATVGEEDPGEAARLEAEQRLLAQVHQAVLEPMGIFGIKFNNDY